MDRDEIERELSEPGARKLLGLTFAHLGYTALDGTPRVIPVGALWTAGTVVICTAPTAPKVRALAARPEVAITFESSGAQNAAQVVSIRGVAAIDVVGGVAEEYLTMARRSMEPVDAAGFEDRVRTMYDRQARIVVTPTWARFYDFDAGRLPVFLQELADRSSS